MDDNILTYNFTLNSYTTMNWLKRPWYVFTLMIACCCLVALSLNSCTNQDGNGKAETEQTNDDSAKAQHSEGDSEHPEGGEHPEGDDQ